MSGVPPRDEGARFAVSWRLLPASDPETQIAAQVVHLGPLALDQIKGLAIEDLGHRTYRDVLTVARYLQKEGLDVTPVLLSDRWPLFFPGTIPPGLADWRALARLREAGDSLESLRSYAKVVKEAAQLRHEREVRAKAAQFIGAENTSLADALAHVLPELQEVARKGQKKRPTPEPIAGLKYNGRGELVRCVENIVTILITDPKWRGVLAWNAFGATIECRTPPPWHPDDNPSPKAGAWQDEDDAYLRTWLSRTHNLTVSRPDVRDAVRMVAGRNEYHPVREYLQGLVWDGRPRVHDWLTHYLGVALTVYTSNVGQWWLISAVARVMRPGCQAKTLLVLEGAQDLKKSTAAKILGDPWYSDTAKEMDNKDFLVGLRNVWIVELAELASLSRHGQDRIKAVLSSQEDKYRAPYGRCDVVHPRQNVFIGTVNPGALGYLKDETGGSRYHPVACTKIDTEALRADRDQLWAEALYLFEQGQRWWAETEEEKALCAEQQDARYQGDSLEERLGAWIEDAMAQSPAHLDRRAILAGELTMEVLLSRGLKISDALRQEKGLQTRVGQAMTRLGWFTRQRTIHGYPKRVRVYLHMTYHAHLA